MKLLLRNNLLFLNSLTSNLKSFKFNFIIFTDRLQLPLLSLKKWRLFLFLKESIPKRIIKPCLKKGKVLCQANFKADLSLKRHGKVNFNTPGEFF